VRDRPPDALAAREVPASDYQGLDLNRLVVWVLGWLRDEELPSSFENIVVAAYRMFPTKFGLRGYDHPDSNRVNRALLQLGPKYRNWARGSAGTGYALTPVGDAVLAALAEKGLQGTAHGVRTGSATTGYTWDPATDMAELRGSGSFARFSKAGPAALKLDDVWDALSAFSYTPREALRKRLAALRRSASDLGDAEVVRFLDALRDRLDGERQRGGHRG
jgi:hypothetical protein